MTDLIYSIQDIFRSTAGGFLEQNNKQYYNIPSYQRGYKWTPLEVEKLLDDVEKFKAEGAKFYCLQNITLVSDGNEYFNIVDGQQRLTTLYILLAFLGKFDLVARKIHYPDYTIRAKTYEFLDLFF